MNENFDVSQQENVPDNMDYIEAIKEMKSNTVAKEDYLKLKEENKKLLNSLVNGETIQQEVKEVKPDINELRAQFFKEGKTNLEMVSDALALRDALIEQGYQDPFIPNGKVATDRDREEAERIAKMYKDCIEYSNGNSEVFTAEVQRATYDDPALINSLRNNRR